MSGQILNSVHAWTCKVSLSLTACSHTRLMDLASWRDVINWHEQISTLTVTLSFCRRKRLGIVLMLHIITIETLVDSLHCLNKYIIFKMTAIVCPKDNIRIYLQRIYDLEKKKHQTLLCVRKSC